MPTIRIGKNPSKSLYNYYKKKLKQKQPNVLTEEERKEAVIKIMHLYDSQQAPGIKPEHQAELQPIYQKLIVEKKNIPREKLEILRKIHSIYIGD